MAEPLGTAELILTVNDQALRQGLADARKLIDGLQNDVNRTTTRARRGQRTAGAAPVPRGGGAREGTRALEIAQERRFRLSQRIETLEERGANVARLRNRLGQLTEAQSNRQFGTFRQISQELARQVTLAERRLRLAEQAQRAEQQAARIGARSGGARESIDALTNAQKRRYRLDQQIRSLEAGGVRTDRLRTQLGEATTAQATRQFGSFNRIADSLEFALRKERDRLRVIRDQNREIERQARRGGPSEPIRGRVGLTGSPADLAFLARQGGPRSPIGGARGIVGSPAAIREEERLTAARERAARAAERTRRAEERAAQAEGRRIGRLNTSPLRGGTSFPGSPAFLDSIFPAFPKEFFAQQKREADKQLRAAAARSKRSRDAASSALIGGAFPLLFGQGIGASLGGAAGGAAGGALGGQFGFGLSLVGTALGAQVDLAVQKLGTLAKALDDPIANFDALIQNASLSSKQVERYAQALIDSGRGAEAAAVIQQDILATFGSLQGAREYNEAVDTISRAWSQASTVLASFVAGPLAGLIRTLSEPTGGFATGVSFEQLVGQLNPEQYRQVQARREQVTEASRQARGGLSAFLPPSNEDVNAGLKAGVALAKELLGIEKQRAELAARLAYAQVQNKRSLSTSYQLIDASTQGYERQSLELQKQQVLNDRNRKLLELTEKERNDPKNPKFEKIQQDATLEEYRLGQQLAQLDKDRAAQSQLDAAQNAIKAQAIAEQVRNTQALAAAEKGVERQTLATIQAVQTGIAESKRRELELGAQIDAARLRGGDAGDQEAARLVGEQRLAANETRLELEKGALALKEAGEQLRDNIRAGVVEFTRVRSDPQGLNRFLNSQQRQQRAENDFRTLLPSFREAQSRFTQLTGARAPEFSGPTAGVNEAIRNFIESVSREFDTTKDLNASLRAASDINTQLISVNTQLAAVTQELAAKRWDVNLILPNGSSVPYQNEQNAAFPL